MGGDISVFVDHFFELMPRLVAVRKPRRRAHIAGYEDLVVLSDYTA
jgi:hypothetical protein